MIYRFLSLLLLIPMTSLAAQIDNPRPNSHQSGLIGLFGWHCGEDRITLRINGSTEIPVVQGVERGDLMAVCGHPNAGWFFQLNTRILPPGANRIEAYADGVRFDAVTFEVVHVTDTEFQTGLSGQCTTTFNGRDVRLGWAEGSQSFIAQHEIESDRFASMLGAWRFTYVILSTFAVDYALLEIETTSAGLTGIIGVDVVGNPLALARTKDLDPESPFTEEYSMLAMGSTLCRLFLFDKVAPDQFAGFQATLDLVGTTCVVPSTVSPREMVAWRLASTVMAGSQDQEQDEPDPPHAKALPVEPHEIQRLVDGLQ